MSIEEKTTSMVKKQPSDEQPWLMPAVIDWLEAILRPTWTVLETGMGGSTIWLAQRVGKLITYENQPWYYDHTLRRLKSLQLNNVEARFRSHYPVAGLGDLPELDLAFIDGRGRVRSVIDAAPRIKSGGWLVLDDSQRQQYREALDITAGWSGIVFRSGDATDSTETIARRKP